MFFSQNNSTIPILIFYISNSIIFNSRGLCSDHVDRFPDDVVETNTSEADENTLNRSDVTPSRLAH